MKRANKFTIPPNWKVLFRDMGIDIAALLAHAKLPSGLFEQPERAHNKVQLSPAQYFQIFDSIDALANGVAMPLKFAEVLSLESFDVPIFAAVCSANLNAALERLRDYKPLIGPMLLDIEQDQTHTLLTLGCYGHEGKLPNNLILTEMVFFTQLARLATRQSIAPDWVQLPTLPPQRAEYEAYFGCELRQGPCAQIRFRSEDATAPFLTDNRTMLALFDNELQQQLDALPTNNSMADRVANVLIDSLAQGESSVEYVASQLAVSKRTLQRKLAQEQQSFQSVLQQVRHQLAEHYLTQTQLPILDVSFLLGFQEANSFIRAYSSWTGHTPTQVRN